MAEGDGPVVAVPLLLIGQPMPMSLSQFTRLDGLPINKIGPSSLHL